MVHQRHHCLLAGVVVNRLYGQPFVEFDHAHQLQLVSRDFTNGQRMDPRSVYPAAHLDHVVIRHARNRTLIGHIEPRVKSGSPVSMASMMFKATPA